MSVCRSRPSPNRAVVSSHATRGSMPTSHGRGEDASRPQAAPQDWAGRPTRGSPSHTGSDHGCRQSSQSEGLAGREPASQRAGWRQVVLTWRAPRPPSIRGVSAAPAACMRWHLDHANHQLAPAARHTSGHLASPPMRASRPPPPTSGPPFLAPGIPGRSPHPPRGTRTAWTALFMRPYWPTGPATRGESAC